jgi:hypothetical protein
MAYSGCKITTFRSPRSSSEAASASARARVGASTHRRQHQHHCKKGPITEAAHLLSYSGGCCAQQTGMHIGCGSTACSVGTVYGGKGRLYTPGVRPASQATPCLVSLATLGRFTDDHPVDHALPGLTPSTANFLTGAT